MRILALAGLLILAGCGRAEHHATNPSSPVVGDHRANVTDTKTDDNAGASTDATPPADTSGSTDTPTKPFDFAEALAKPNAGEPKSGQCYSLGADLFNDSRASAADGSDDANAWSAERQKVRDYCGYTPHD